VKRSYGWHDIQVFPDDLQFFAWSAPMRELAVKVDMSDIGLKKMLASYGVVTPSQGFWNKVHAGRSPRLENRHWEEQNYGLRELDGNLPWLGRKKRR
jgi:hypothetical protein